ncbi:nitrate reductase cytochrome c-type subunit [Catenovulum sp. 2E275]|uniref:nitrate reductase cytochrome c-type subunit n=1 Tax=Catenovulum sp. 2E275 TaxID=2980497 RepID=UPI0021D282D1|nr:nitrate reductase cytochrome c-type subunit [Catenovulum sp. 2E275]MCU4676705.1 nitrate reductase cytochrome c-type subunit [Catenovulum sp. 2E275]
MKLFTQMLSLISLCFVVSFAGAEPINPILQAEIDQPVSAPPIAKPINNDLKQARNYPMQPPLIPHNIRGYEINLNVNKCMACHSRTRTEDSQAPMISVTHFMDRDSNFLAEISPRRYFCNQCHVPQTDAKDVVENNFVDMEHIMQSDQQNNQGANHD